MAIHWTISFKSRRSATVYTVNIYDSSYSGSPIPLKGGAEPFITQENDDDDAFIPVRTQSGYLRIVDDGKDADGNAFSWRDLLPTTDTDRPVTLTAGGTILWQGFMQAQNFGGVLYGNPQEREYPLQCALCVTEGTDVSFNHMNIENFAYLLDEIVSSIPTISIDTIAIQGGADAQSWLLKLIDWQNFATEDGDGNLTAQYNLFQCLEDICRFWGWTARTYRQTLYLTCADDSSESQWLILTRAQLTTLASGSTAGSTNGSFLTTTLSGDIFANTVNNDYQNRGPNKATVTADVNDGDSDVVMIYPASVIEDMNSGGSYTPSGGGFGGSGSGTVHYTNDVLTFTSNLLEGTCRSGYASFNIATSSTGDGTESHCVIKITESFASTSDTGFATLQTARPHAFSDGLFEFSCELFRGYEKYMNYNDSTGEAETSMYMRFGVGMTRASALWYQGGGFGDSQGWISTETAFSVPAGGKDSTFLYVNSRNITLCGYIYIDFLGSNDIEEIDGVRSFDIADFTVTFMRNDTAYTTTQLPTGNFARIVDREMNSRVVYKSENQNNVRQEWNADTIFASENNTKYGYGVILNDDYTYMEGVTYGSSATIVHPEQHLADRVTTYWATSKRKLEIQARTNTVAEISPRYKVTMDGSTCYPIGISYNWRNEIIMLTLLEL